MLKSTPAVLSIGFRCRKLGYTFVWPAYGNPYFLLPSGNLVYLEVHKDIPYLRPGVSAQVRPTGSRCYACGAEERTGVATPGESGIPDDSGTSGIPDEGADVTPPVPTNEEPEEGNVHIDVEELEDEHHADRILPIDMRKSLRQEAKSVRHLCTHLPKNPYCEDCCRGKMKHAPKYKGSFKPTAEKWGQQVSGDTIKFPKYPGFDYDETEDFFLTLKDVYSELEHLYPLDNGTTASDHEACTEI